MRAPIQLSLTLVVVACSDGMNPSPADPATEPPTEVSQVPARDPATIEFAHIDGVWTFFNQPDGHGNAQFTGTARIVDGCLRANDYVLVWMKPDEHRVTEFRPREPVPHVEHLVQRASRGRLGAGVAGI